MRKYFLIAAFAIVFVLIAGFGNAYDQKRPDVDPIKVGFDASFTYLRIVSRGTAIGLVWDNTRDMYRIKEGVFVQGGSATVVAAGYVLTAAHILTPKIITIPEGKVSSRVTDVIGMTSRTVTMYDYKDDAIIATVLYENPHTDLAILKYNHSLNSWLKPVPFAIEYGREELKAGDVVCSVLHKRYEGNRQSDVELRWGIITHPEPYAPESSIIAWFTPWDITMDLAVQGGDSGSPLFVFRNGKPILIGVVRAFYVNYFLFAYYSYAAQLPVIDKLLLGRR